ncbi:hypothetical protein WN71_030870 [Streptomyces mangrovisoli]|uniref:Uncharacterized protein n=1 Tax=Streptomyces mangrovisoli TaxID=1428628 RepID=A0A1J4NPI2_9ACTN|nr:hypothetical protein WN71_030870 [Streptomyces mangrovisoli]
MLALSSCSSVWGCSDTTAKRGQAAVRVQVENASGQRLGVTAEVVDWRLAPHPQTPDAGDMVHFHFRFDGVDEYSGPAVDACAVDKKRVALGCLTVYSSDVSGPGGSGTGDDWLTVQHPEQVAGVLLVPNDQSGGRPTCERDPKDGGGPHPPEPASVGDQL